MARLTEGRISLCAAISSRDERAADAPIDRYGTEHKMAKRSGKHQTKNRTRSPWETWRRALVAVLGLGGAAIVLGFLFTRGGGPSSPAPWTRLGTADVHSLAFVGDSGQQLLFGHHNGVLRTTDGGRTWTPLPVRQDAMGMAAAPDSSIVIAGHNVFAASLDGGATWAPVESNLPNLDIHGFTRSVNDPSTMWAYLAEGAVYMSSDFGATWSEVYSGHVQQLNAIERDGRDALLGIDLRGLITSSDGGSTWVPVGTPPTAPVTSLAATKDGRVIALGGLDGLYLSRDGGAMWQRVLNARALLAAALDADGHRIAAVTQDTSFYRSDDGGATWPGPT